MTMKMVTLRGVSQRGTNRVREHGPTFKLVREGLFRREPALLLRCCALHSTKCDWLGWLVVGGDAPEAALVEES